jgi:heptosyltransferase-1
MGDILHTLPALTDAGKAHSNISFDWVVEESFAEIPGWHKLVDKVIPVALRYWRTLKIHKWRSCYNNLKAEQYDFIIDAQSLIKSAIITRLAKGVRCGMDKNSAREPLAALCYQRKFYIPKDQHAISRVRELFAQALNYKMPNDLPDYSLDSRVRRNDEHYLVFIHGTSRKDKLWPEQNWIALAKLAAKKGYRIKIPQSNNEEYKRAKHIAAECENVEILARSNLTTLKNILSAAQGVVAIDTGLGHLAAALGVPTVSLYGPTDPELIGTVGKSVKHLNMNMVSHLDIIP